MKETFNEFMQAKNAVLNSLQNIFNTMQEELRDMVHQGKIESFSFLRNDIYSLKQNPVYIAVTSEHIKQDVRLGVFADVHQQYQSNTKLPEATLKDLQKINEVLYLLNDHFVKDLPIIAQSSYYSKKAANKEVGFASENILLSPLLQFKENDWIEQRKVKTKIR